MVDHQVLMGAMPKTTGAMVSSPYLASNYLPNMQIKSDLNLAMNWLYFIVKLMISLVTILCLALVVYAGAYVLTYDGPDFRVFVTNSHYTSMQGDVTPTGNAWPILPIPSQDVQRRTSPYDNVKFEHFYDCMWISNLSACNNTPAIADYQTCVDARYSSLLSTCAAQNSILPSWPTAYSYTSCLNTGMGGDRKSLNAFRTCVKIRSWPLYDTPQDLDTNVFLGSFSWPMLMITGFFLYVAFGLYTVYPIDWEDTLIIEYGKPRGRMGFSRMGFSWMLVPLIMSGIWSVICVLIAFRAGSTWPNNNANPFPSTQSTNIVTVSASLLCFFYFLMEVSEYYDKKKNIGLEEEPPKSEEEGGPQPKSRMSFGIPASLVMTNGYQGATPHGLGYFFPNPTESVSVDSIEEAGQQYTPVLLNTWSDAYLFDILFLVGAFGATLQVQTADIFTLFWALVYYRVAHMGVVRMVYQSYVRVSHEDDATNRQRDSRLPENNDNVQGKKRRAILDASLCMRINGFVIHLGALCALVVIYRLVMNPNRIWKEFETFNSLFLYGLFIPELLRLIGHLYLILRTSEFPSGKGVYILVFSHIFWLWDLLIRGVFMFYFFYGSTNLQGTKPFLVDSWNYLNGTLTYMGSAS